MAEADAAHLTGVYKVFHLMFLQALWAPQTASRSQGVRQNPDVKMNPEKGWRQNLVIQKRPLAQEFLGFKKQNE
jgi:hypothetical protein